MHWIYLVLAGAFEIGFTTCLKLSDGFTRLWWSIAFVVSAIISFTFLNLSVDVIPISTAYAVWTGIGAAGTTIVGMTAFSEPVRRIRIVLIFGLVAAVVGLKFVSVA